MDYNYSLVSCAVHNDPSPQGGGASDAPRAAPRCPEVRAVRRAARPGVSGPSGRGGGGAARGGGQEKKGQNVRFYDFWSFLANFCLFVSSSLRT